MAVDHKAGKITALYRKIIRLYSEVPYRLFRSGRSFPTWHYYFEVTRRCNLRCKMCQYIDWLEATPTKVQRDGELSTEQWLDVVDQTTPWSLITFTGGEIFVRKDFMEILERACSKRRVHFISNATMLTEERCQQVVDLAPKKMGRKGFNFAGISIDGTRDVHDVIRAQKGSFDKSMKGIKMLSQFRDESGKQCPIIHINTVIQQDNLHVLPEMPQIAKEAGVDVLNMLTEMRAHDHQNLGHVDPSTFGRDDIKNPIMSRAEVDDAMKKTLAAAKEVGVEVRLPRMPYDMLLDHYDGGYDLSEFECRSIWTNLYVGAKGGVYPCFLLKVGNAKDQTLKEIWNSPKLREFRQRRRDGGFAACRGCCELEHTGKNGTAKTEYAADPNPDVTPTAASAAADVS